MNFVAVLSVVIDRGHFLGSNDQSSRRSVSFYFQVRGNGDYTMLGVSDKSDATCNGPNIHDEMETK